MRYGRSKPPEREKGEAVPKANGCYIEGPDIQITEDRSYSSTARGFVDRSEAGLEQQLLTLSYLGAVSYLSKPHT